MNIPDFFANYSDNGKPWLLIGMGPSFSSFQGVDFSSYNTFGLNKVPREIPVDICQIIDFYIAEQIAPYILHNASHLVMPYYPHFGCRPNKNLQLWNLAMYIPVVKKMQEQGRLLGYNLSTSPWRASPSPIVKARYFSAESAVSLLGHLGVKTIRTLGIDGGMQRAANFSDHGPVDPRGFDLQWAGISETVSHFSIDFAPLFS